jgi:hypothetical protein
MASLILPPPVKGGQFAQQTLSLLVMPGGQIVNPLAFFGGQFSVKLCAVSATTKQDDRIAVDADEIEIVFAHSPASGEGVAWEGSGVSSRSQMMRGGRPNLRLPRDLMPLRPQRAQTTSPRSIRNTSSGDFGSCFEQRISRSPTGWRRKVRSRCKPR